jgi:hypothetical protein
MTATGSSPTGRSSSRTSSSITTGATREGGLAHHRDAAAAAHRGQLPGVLHVRVERRADRGDAAEAPASGSTSTSSTSTAAAKTEEYIVPNDDQCASCHERDDVQHSLGLITPQMNRMVERDGEDGAADRVAGGSRTCSSPPPAPASAAAFVDPLGQRRARSTGARARTCTATARTATRRAAARARAGWSSWPPRPNPAKLRDLQGAGGGGAGRRAGSRTTSCRAIRRRASSSVSHELARSGDQDARAAEPGDRHAQGVQLIQRLDRGDAGRRLVRCVDP